jgi:transmembrane sensor
LIDSAARWYARLASPHCTQQDRDEFEHWRRADPAHGQAYAAARRLAEDVFAIVAADPRLRSMADEAIAIGAKLGDDDLDELDELDDIAVDETDDVAVAARRLSAPQPRRRQRWTVPAALAASIAAVALVGGAVRVSRPTTAAFEHVATADHRREVALDDGTVVYVDVQTEFEVRLTAVERLVVLTRGRAIFDVAHDAERPFSVVAGGERVTALGTRFEVRRIYEQTIITLAEGAVTVSGEIRGEPQTQRLEPGEQLSIYPRGAEWAKRRVDPSAATSWSLGRHVFRDERLADALDEVNLYAEIKVRLADPSLADLPVSGSFISGDSEAIVTAFAAVLPLRIADGGDELLVFRRREARTDR